jgi:hypothetical protein
MISQLGSLVLSVLEDGGDEVAASAAGASPCASAAAVTAAAVAAAAAGAPGSGTAAAAAAASLPQPCYCLRCGRGSSWASLGLALDRNGVVLAVGGGGADGGGGGGGSVAGAAGGGGVVLPGDVLLDVNGVPWWELPNPPWLVGDAGDRLAHFRKGGGWWGRGVVAPAATGACRPEARLSPDMAAARFSC